MEKIKIQKNSGDILKAEDIGSIISAINDIIDYLTSNDPSGGQSEPGTTVGDIVEKVKVYISNKDYDLNVSTPIAPYGLTQVGIPWGIWLYSYLSSDMENPIKTRLLSQDEYTQYLGQGYNIKTNVDIEYNSDVFMDEYFREPLQVLTYFGNSTSYSGVNMTKDSYYIKGAPRVWDVFADPKYDKYFGSESRPKDKNHFTYYNEGMTLWSPIDDDPVVKFTGTVTVTKGDGSKETVSKSASVPIYANRDLVLDNLFCIIPKEMCTFEQFAANPQQYIDQIKQNDKNPIIVQAEDQMTDDILNEYRKAIRAYAIGMHGLSESNVSTVDSYLQEQKAKYNKKRIPIDKVGAEIVAGWFTKYQPGLNVKPQDIDQSYLYSWGWYDADEQRWTAKQGYYATSVQHILDIPRFNKVYTLDNVMENGDGYFFKKGPIEDTPYAPRFKDGTKHRASVIDGTIEVRQGDIVLQLQNNENANKTLLLYNVMDKTTTGDWYSTLKAVRDIATVAHATKYIDRVGRVRGWNPESQHYLNEECTIPYEDIIDMDTKEIVDSESSNTYARYGGTYTILAFEVEEKFYIKDTKWGFGMNYPTDEYFDD